MYVCDLQRKLTILLSVIQHLIQTSKPIYNKKKEDIISPDPVQEQIRN